MAVSPETPTALAGLPCQRGVTPLDSPLPTRPACRQWGLRPPSGQLPAVPAPIRLAAPSSALPRRASAPPLLRPVRLTIAKACQVLLFSTRQTAPLTQCIAFNAREESNALKPIKRNVWLTTICERCQDIVYSLFKPKGIPVGKNVIDQTRTIQLAAITENWLSQCLVDFDSRLPQSLIVCDRAVVALLVQMVTGKDSL